MYGASGPSPKAATSSPETAGASRSTPPKAAAPPTSAAVGSRVMVQGLSKAAQYNGKFGIVSEIIDKDGEERLCVVLEGSGRQLSVKRANAQVVTANKAATSHHGSTEASSSSASRPSSSPAPKAASSASSSKKSSSKKRAKTAAPSSAGTGAGWGGARCRSGYQNPKKAAWTHKSAKEILADIKQLGVPRDRWPTAASNLSHGSAWLAREDKYAARLWGPTCVEFRLPSINKTKAAEVFALMQEEPV